MIAGRNTLLVSFENPDFICKFEFPPLINSLENVVATTFSAQKVRRASVLGSHSCFPPNSSPQWLTKSLALRSVAHVPFSPNIAMHLR